MFKQSIKKLVHRFQSIHIATKITIFYGGIFSLSILVISGIIIANSIAINETMAKQELLKSVENIEQALLNGQELTQQKLQEMMQNKYVEVAVYNNTKNIMLTNAMGELPPFVARFDREGHQTDASIQQPSPQMPPGQTDGLEKLDSPPPEEQKNKRKSPFFGNGLHREYSVQVDKDREFMLMDRTVEMNGDFYFIQAYKMMADKYFYLRWFGARLILLDAVGILLAFLIGRYLSKLFLNPIENIRAMAEKISIEDLSQRLSVPMPNDEMKELTVTFNSMIERLETSFKKQNQFISDASHELRTPISVIQGYANLVNRWGKSDPTVLQESIDSILAETEHMSTLIKKLLFLAKSDQNRNHIQKIRLNLSEVASEVSRELEVMQTGRTIKLLAAPIVEIYADYDLMKQLLWIYLENSLKYTQEQGEITIRVWKEHNHAYLSVKDNGAGMSKDELPLIFDRFYRVDKSRNKEIPGTGLGLSIAKWILDSHNAIVTVESQIDNGTEFINRFEIFEENNALISSNTKKIN